MNITKYYLTNNRCYQKNVKRVPIGIQLHSIGTGQGTAKAVADYWNQASVSACVTYIVDCDTPGKVIQTLPEDVRTWADAGYGNNNLITFEICESDFIKYTGGASYNVIDSAKFKADILRGYDTAVELCADICKRYGWDPTKKLPSGLYLISSHEEGYRAGLSSNHADPVHVWSRFGLTMDGFRKDVKAALSGKVVNQEKASPLYRVRTSWTDVNSQTFAGTLGGAKKAAESAKNKNKKTYYVFDSNGTIVYIAQYNIKYIVQAGSYTSKSNAESQFRKVKSAGFSPSVNKVNGEYKVQIDYNKKYDALNAVKTLKSKGFSAFLV